MAKSVALERKVSGYPSTVHYKLVIAECKLKGCSKSSIVSEALKQYYNNMSEPDKRMIMGTIKDL